MDSLFAGLFHFIPAAAFAIPVTGADKWMMTFTSSRCSPRLVRPGPWPVLQADHGIATTTQRYRVAARTAAVCAGSAAAGSRLNPAGAIVITGFV